MSGVDTEGRPIHSVELLGFDAKDRAILDALFKLSETRPQRFVEFSPLHTGRPDCLLVDGDDPQAWAAFKARRRASYRHAVGIGTRLPPADTDDLADRIERPVRWARMLEKLESLFGQAQPDADGDLNPGSVTAAEWNARADALELAQVRPWYDHTGPPVLFRTVAGLLVAQADDDTLLRIRSELAGLPFRIDHARDADSAMDHLEMNRYNIAFIDPDLPGDAFALVHDVVSREDRRRIAAVMISRRGGLGERLKAMMAGANAFLALPLERSRLDVVLDRFMPRWQMFDPAQAPAHGMPDPTHDSATTVAPPHPPAD